MEAHINETKKISTTPPAKDKDGNLQAIERTLKGEMMVLRQLAEAVDENFKFHKWLLADLNMFLSLKICYPR